MLEMESVVHEIYLVFFTTMRNVKMCIKSMYCDNMLPNRSNSNYHFKVIEKYKTNS